jgi:hypothetical protein
MVIEIEAGVFFDTLINIYQITRQKEVNFIGTCMRTSGVLGFIV